MKQVCHRCIIEKSLSDFYRQTSSKTGHGRECKSCNYSRLKGRKAKPATTRNAHLKRTYGITLKQETELLIAQNHRCLICCKHQDEIKTKLHIDHDHSTGAVRGLLCFNCNQLLGNARDSESVLASAIEYLRRSRLKVAS